MPTRELSWTRWLFARTRNLAPIAVAGLVAFSLVACGGTAEDPADTADGGEIGEPITSGAMTGSIAFRSPKDGATVSSPVEVCLDTAGAVIVPAGTQEPGSGHHHILVNPTEDETAMILAGEPAVIPNDATHIHLGDASACTEIELEPGEHVLLAVLADGAHTNLNPAVTDELTITVE